MAFAKNEIIELTISSLSNDGSGVGRYEEKIVFVPGSAVGDKLNVKILKDKKTHAFGKIEEIVSPSNDRRAAPCPIAAHCGGCDFQHIEYPAQLLAKQNFVRDALVRIAKIDIPILPIIASYGEFCYRNKVQYPVTQGEDGLEYGFYAKRSHRIIPCKNCLLQPEILNEIADFTIGELSKLNVTAYNEETHTGLLRHLYLRHSVKTGNVMLCLVLTKNKLQNRYQFVEDVLSKYPQVETIVLNINPLKTNIICGKENIVLHGKGFIEDSFCGVPLELNPLSFAQVNSRTAEKLFSVVKDFALPTKDDILLDLYCGAGIIGLSMAAECKNVVGVEIVPEAIEAAKNSAAKMHLSNTEFICDDAENAVKTLEQRNIAPNIVIIDPPRKGCSEKTLDIVSTMQPNRIVMVSCDPATAARDIAILAASGYELLKVQPVDMFPNTKHVECVVLMSRLNTF